MSIKHWPNTERPREKLLEKGADALSEAELLAIIFRTGTKGKSAIELARDSLQCFGSLKALCHADAKQFCQQKGLGPTRYAELQAALELNRRYLFSELKQSNYLSNAKQTEQYLLAKLARHKQEVFAALFLDTNFQLIHYTELAKGNVNRVDIYPGELAKLALQHHASSVIVAHNHPSGHLTPSEHDKKMTEHLREALQLLDIRLLDHVIVAGSQTLSFMKQGLL